MQVSVTYLGILARADPSVVGLLIGEGVRLEERSREQAHEVLAIMEGHPVNPGWADPYLFMLGGYRVGVEPSIVLASREWQIDQATSADDSFLRLSADNLQTVFGTSKTVDDGLACMRLFKSANIGLARSFTYAMWGGRPQMLLGTGGWGGMGPGDPYILAPEERETLQELLSTLKIPLVPPYIELARECYEQAFNAYGTALPLLSVTMGLEALFGSGNSKESRMRILDGVSKLLEPPGEARAVLRRSAERIYERRSAAIHTGRGQSVSRDDLAVAKEVLRRSILEAARLGLPKSQFEQRLGFSSQSSALLEQSSKVE